MSSPKVQLRGGFSDRHRINPVNTEIQINELDKRTRSKIANLLKQWYKSIQIQGNSNQFCVELLDNVFAIYVSDDINFKIQFHNDEFITKYLFEPILNNPYDEVLTLVEYTAGYVSILKEEFFKYPFNFSNDSPFPDTSKELNELFESEFVGYRIISNQIVPISDDLEIESINKGLANEFDGVKSHIKKSLSLLSDRENPDYKNSIKESISSVEAICQIIVKDEKATLGQAINELHKNGIKIHPSLEGAFKKLYGYTSDQGGIRHAEGIEESCVSFSEAKFMLVACSAFVNYLTEEYGKHDNQ
mgnify:CR=1 FL=1